MSDESTSQLSQSNQLYRHFDCSGKLLYIGVSYGAFVRLAQHRAASHWYSQIANMTIEQFPTREDLLAAEAYAIKLERPLHNTVHAHYNKRPPDLQRALESKLSLLRQVAFKPVYTVREAADCLRLSPGRIRDMVAVGRLGTIDFKDGLKSPKTLITGWQIIDLLESLGLAIPGEGE